MIEIPYWGTSGKKLVVVLSSTVAMYCLIVFGMKLAFDSMEDPFIPLFILCSLLVVPTLFMYLSFLYRNQFIRLSENEIEFSSIFAPNLLFKTKRSWEDVSSVLVGSMVLGSDKSTYEFDLESSENKKKVFLYFKSGGHASIDLTRMDSHGSEALFRNIESKYLDMSRIPVEKLDVDSEDPFANRDTKSDATDKLESYTEIWESGIENQFSSTNYVPLKKGDRLLDGRYKVKMSLSSGGLSSVYLIQTKHKEYAVLKESVIPEDLKLETKVRELFEREVSLLQKIDHPKIVKVLDCFTEQNRDYIVLEYLPGSTLREHILQYGPIEESEALSIINQVALIVAYLHNLSPPILHRDISPSNLILKEDGSIHLVDFGAANQLISKATGTLVGKQSFMAPEQFRGKAEPASDIYGIGSTLHFILTGEDPVPLETSHPRQINKDITPATDKLVSSCTNQSIEYRLNSLDSFSKRVSKILDEGGGAVIDLN